ncbi:hypothetical protein BTM119_09340 [Helicobacter pylori]
MPKTLPVDPIGLRANAYMLTQAVRPLVRLRASSLCYESGAPFKNRMLVLECVIYQFDKETITTAIAKPASWLMLALKLWILK